MNSNINVVIEGLLFVYGEDGISLLDIQNVLENVKPNDIRQAIIDLNKRYQNDPNSPFMIQVYGKNRYRLQTKPELYEYFAKLEIFKDNRKLSRSIIEVLSIIVCKGPISKSQIDYLRNSDSSYQMQKLREKKLIKVNKKDELTRANLYVVTENFFKLFNLKGDVDKLPTLSDDEINEIIKQAQNDLSIQEENQELFSDVSMFDNDI